MTHHSNQMMTPAIIAQLVAQARRSAEASLAAQGLDAQSMHAHIHIDIGNMGDVAGFNMEALQ